MGYTHYWTIKKNQIVVGTKETMIANMQKVVDKYNTIIQLENDIVEPAHVSSKAIRFNGIGDDGHETFLLEFTESSDFCKTARKPYDQPVCEILLIAKYHYGKNMELSSDGFGGDTPDESWPMAFENVNKMGYVISYDVVKE